MHSPDQKKVAWLWARHIWRTLGLGLAAKVSGGRLGDGVRWRLVQSGMRARRVAEQFRAVGQRLPRVYEQQTGALAVSLDGTSVDLRTAIDLPRHGSIALLPLLLDGDSGRWSYVESVAELFVERLIARRTDEDHVDVWTYVIGQFLLNAVQHGHEGDWSRSVLLHWELENERLTVDVHDEGQRPWGSHSGELLLHFDMPIGGVGVALDYARHVFMDRAEWGDRNEAGRVVGHRQKVSGDLARPIRGFWTQRVLCDIVRNDLNARRYNQLQSKRG